LLADTRAKAEKGDAQSASVMGSVFLFGILGVAKDEAEALKWFLKAAEQGHAEAQFNTGVCYENGQGVPQDYAEAVRWYRKAAEQDEATAQWKLGLCYANGHGVAQEYAEAYRWTLLSSAQGDEFARGAITLLEKLMTQEQIAAGQRLAHGFKAR